MCNNVQKKDISCHRKVGKHNISGCLEAASVPIHIVNNRYSLVSDQKLVSNGDSIFDTEIGFIICTVKNGYSAKDSNWFKILVKQLLKLSF